MLGAQYSQEKKEPNTDVGDSNLIQRSNENNK